MSLIPTVTQLKTFVKTPVGRTVLVLVVLLFGVLLVSRFTAPPKARESAPAPIQPDRQKEPVREYTRRTADLPPVSTSGAVRRQAPSATPTQTPLPPERLVYSSFQVEQQPSPTATAQPVQPVANAQRTKRPDAWAPYGRLVKCELVNTVDSIRPLTPMIGMVTEDVWWNHRLVIPASSEVHGQSEPNNAAGRIGSKGPWVIVLPSGSEWTVKARVLDMAQTNGDETWGISDGSYGIEGATISNEDEKSVKVFASTFLSAAASALQSNHSNNQTGQLIPDNTPQNASLAGASALINQYSQQIIDAIRRDGAYTRVPGGKQFYLYLEQTVRKSDAQIGNSEAASKQFDAEAAELNRGQGMEPSLFPSYQGSRPLQNSYSQPYGESRSAQPALSRTNFPAE